MKKPFRHFRGEFFQSNYLYKLLISPNYAVQDIINEIVYQTLVQWKTEDEAKPEEMPMRDEDIVNIGIIAGVFQSLGFFITNNGSIVFTRNKIVNGIDRSERGIYNMFREVYEYTRLEHDDYDTDIATEASSQRRITLVPPGTAPVGYVKEGTPLFEIDGTVIWENLLAEPPDDGSAYIPFFGEEYLFFEEEFIQEANLTVRILKLLIECMQTIRYNGPTIATFLQIAWILGEGYIYDIDIIPKAEDEEATIHYEIQYKLNRDIIIDQYLRRYASWQILCRSKFKQFALKDITKD
jgi:hypothetical protein